MVGSAKVSTLKAYTRDLVADTQLPGFGTAESAQWLCQQIFL